jgi:hypothetical protein
VLITGIKSVSNIGEDQITLSENKGKNKYKIRMLKL